MKYFKYIFVIIIILVSFYLTEKSAIFVRSKDPIMQTIREYSKDYNTDAIDAVIDDDYIIPGLYGKRVNEIKSLMKMKSLKTFNSMFLKTDYVRPNISLDDNKDKIINKGNQKKNSVSIIINSSNPFLKSYFYKESIDVSVLVDKTNLNGSDTEIINNDFKNYDDIEKILNKESKNTNICIINRTNKNFCIKHKKYLVEPTYVVTKSNLVIIKNKISSGDILLINDNLSLDDIYFLINYIKSKSLNIIKLSQLINEK